MASNTCTGLVETQQTKTSPLAATPMPVIAAAAGLQARLAHVESHFAVGVEHVDATLFAARGDA